MKKHKYRTIVTYENYFEEFFAKQEQKVKDKIIWTLELMEDVQLVPVKFLKLLQDGLYEIRVQHGKNIFRIFCFFDSGNVVVLLNGFQKKSPKIPIRELKKAIEIRKRYQNEK